MSDDYDARQIQIGNEMYKDGSIPGFNVESGNGKNKWKKFTKDDLEKIKLKPLQTDKEKVFEDNAKGEWEYPGTER